MAYGARPTIRRKILGRKLSAAREAANLSVEQVAEHAGKSGAAIYRQESGHTAVQASMIPFYANLYGIDDKEEIERWTAWAKKAKQRGTWATSGSLVGPSYQDYADAESLCLELRTWELGVIPGLLQTKQYSEAVIRAAATVRPGQLPSEEGEVEALVGLRESRKQILDSETAPRIWAVIGQPAVMTPPDPRDPKSHREQIQHLLNLGETKATIQVLTTDSGLHVGLSGSFSILSFDDADMVFREGYGDGSFVDEEVRVRSYQARYERLQSQALSVLDTRQLLLETFNSLAKG